MHGTMKIKLSKVLSMIRCRLDGVNTLNTLMTSASLGTLCRFL